MCACGRCISCCPITLVGTVKHRNVTSQGYTLEFLRQHRHSFGGVCSVLAEANQKTAAAEVARRAAAQKCEIFVTRRRYRNGFCPVRVLAGRKKVCAVLERAVCFVRVPPGESSTAVIRQRKCPALGEARKRKKNFQEGKDNVPGGRRINPRRNIRHILQEATISQQQQQPSKEKQTNTRSAPSATVTL